MITSGDPYRDFDRYDAECEKARAKLPVCEECRESITDDYYYDIYGDIYCPDCLDRLFRKSTEDYERSE